MRQGRLGPSINRLVSAQSGGVKVTRHDLRREIDPTIVVALIVGKSTSNQHVMAELRYPER